MSSSLMVYHPSVSKQVFLIFLTVYLLSLAVVLAGTVALDKEQKEQRLFAMSSKPFSKTLNLLNLMLKGPKNKISPLYLINGTICRYINTVPICTSLETTGLQTSQGSSGGSGGSSRPSSSSGGGGGSSGGSVGSSGSSGGGGSSSGGGGSSGSGGSSGGSRPSSAGQLGSSSVQYLGRPLADDSLDLQVSGSSIRGPLTSQLAQNSGPRVGLFVRTRPLGLFGIRPPPILQQSQSQMMVQKASNIKHLSGQR